MFPNHFPCDIFEIGTDGIGRTSHRRRAPHRFCSRHAVRLRRHAETWQFAVRRDASHSLAREIKRRAWRMFSSVLDLCAGVVGVVPALTWRLLGDRKSVV